MLIQLGCTELGVAWDLAGLVPPPAVFTVRSQRGPADAMAMGRLVALGLIDRRGIIRPDLHQAMVAFTQSPLEVDLKFPAGRGVVVRAAVAVHDSVAFLAVVTNGHVRFSRVPAETALTTLVDVLPYRPLARGTLVTLPTAEVHGAVLVAMERGMSGDPDVDHDAIVAAELVRRGVAVTDARLFVRLASAHRLRAAEFGVTRRDRTLVRRRCPRVVRVIDTRAGRAVTHERGDYTLAAPGDGPTVVRALTGLCDAEPDRLGGNRLG